MPKKRKPMIDKMFPEKHSALDSMPHSEISPGKQETLRFYAALNRLNDAVVDHYASLDLDDYDRLVLDAMQLLFSPPIEERRDLQNPLRRLAHFAHDHGDGSALQELAQQTRFFEAANAFFAPCYKEHDGKSYVDDSASLNQLARQLFTAMESERMNTPSAIPGVKLKFDKDSELYRLETKQKTR